MEEVVEPWADFKTAAMTKPISRNIIPLALELETYSFKSTSTPLDLITAPKEPPAPVMSKIIPASLNASDIQVGHSLFWLFLIKVNASANPMASAIIG
jgi:hypothetical protein